MKKPWLDGGNQPGPYATATGDTRVDPVAAYG